VLRLRPRGGAPPPPRRRLRHRHLQPLLRRRRGRRRLNRQRRGGAVPLRRPGRNCLPPPGMSRRRRASRRLQRPHGKARLPLRLLRPRLHGNHLRIPVVRPDGEARRLRRGARPAQNRGRGPPGMSGLRRSRPQHRPSRRHGRCLPSLRQPNRRGARLLCQRRLRLRRLRPRHRPRQRPRRRPPLLRCPPPSAPSSPHRTSRRP